MFCDINVTLCKVTISQIIRNYNYKKKLLQKNKRPPSLLFLIKFERG
jgi:hypothetical protein